MQVDLVLRQSPGDPLVGNNNRHSLGMTDQNTNRGTGGEATYPSHHREDAIAGVPSPQLHEIQAMNSHPGQAQNVTSEYDPSRAEYRNPAEHTDYESKVPSSGLKGDRFGVGAASASTNRPVN